MNSTLDLEYNTNILDSVIILIGGFILTGYVLLSNLS